MKTTYSTWQIPEPDYSQIDGSTLEATIHQIYNKLNSFCSCGIPNYRHLEMEPLADYAGWLQALARDKEAPANHYDTD